MGKVGMGFQITPKLAHQLDPFPSFQGIILDFPLSNNNTLL